MKSLNNTMSLVYLLFKYNMIDRLNEKTEHKKKPSIQLVSVCDTAVSFPWICTYNEVFGQHQMKTLKHHIKK